MNHVIASAYNRIFSPTLVVFHTSFFAFCFALEVIITSRGKISAIIIKLPTDPIIVCPSYRKSAFSFNSRCFQTSAGFWFWVVALLISGVRGLYCKYRIKNIINLGLWYNFIFHLQFLWESAWQSSRKSIGELGRISTSLLNNLFSFTVTVLSLIYFVISVIFQNEFSHVTGVLLSRLISISFLFFPKQQISIESLLSVSTDHPLPTNLHLYVPSLSPFPLYTTLLFIYILNLTF